VDCLRRNEMESASHPSYNSIMTRTEIDANLRQVAAIGTPVEVVDTSTQEVFYLVSAEQFRAIEMVLTSEADARAAYPLLERVMADDDANDPLLDSYQ
jgi:hypothetical protein